jgi:hypothetical protein
MKTINTGVRQETTLCLKCKKPNRLLKQQIIKQEKTLPLQAKF